MVERAEWDGEQITSTRNVTDHGGNCIRPILFLAEFDTCKDFCSENFCYNLFEFLASFFSGFIYIRIQ